METALDAIHARQAVLRNAFDKAIQANLHRLHCRFKAHPEELTKEALQAALGKIPPKSCVWGIAGQVPIGVSVSLNAGDEGELVEVLRNMSSTCAAELIVGTPEAVEIWFRGPRPLGDFLLDWCE